MQANRFAAKKAKPFNSSYGDDQSKNNSRADSRRIRRKVSGTSERPRLCVHFSGKHVYAQVMDDEAGQNACFRGHDREVVKRKGQARRQCATAEKVGKLIAERLLEKKIDKVVFDRGGLLFTAK